MSNFARINEAFPREKGSSSSSSIRNQPSKYEYNNINNPFHSSNQEVQQSKTNDYLNDFNQNYQIEDNNRYNSNCNNCSHHKQNINHNYYQKDENENICINLINQVLQNETCKRILKNILLDEYLDSLIKQRISGFNNNNRYDNQYANQYANNAIYSKPAYNPSSNNEIIEGFTNYLQSNGLFNFNKTIFGMDVKTIMILILIAIVCLYLYDLFRRLF